MTAATGEQSERGAAATMATPLARVRGLGAAHGGAHHWLEERTSALATFLLFVWLIVSLVRLPDLGHATITDWLGSPLAAVPMLLLIAATFRHIQLGLKVVIEDYVHDEGNRLFALLLVDFASILGAALAAFAVLKIALGGNPD